jgi:hypothetical protein
MSSKDTLRNPARHYYRLNAELDDIGVYMVTGYDNNENLLSGRLEINMNSLRSGSHKLKLYLLQRTEKLEKITLTRSTKVDGFFYAERTNPVNSNKNLLLGFFSENLKRLSIDVYTAGNSEKDVSLTASI